MKFSTTGGELQYDAKRTDIYYFDSPFESDMLDSRYTYSKFMGSTTPGITVGGNEINTGQKLDQKIGQYYDFRIFSYFKQDMPKDTGNDIFFLRMVTYDTDQELWGQQDSVYISTYEGGNEYNI